MVNSESFACISDVLHNIVYFSLALYMGHLPLVLILLHLFLTGIPLKQWKSCSGYFWLNPLIPAPVHLEHLACSL